MVPRLQPKKEIDIFKGFSGIEYMIKDLMPIPDLIL